MFLERIPPGNLLWWKANFVFVVIMIDPDGAWYPSEYKSDIYTYLKTLEKERFTFLNRSPQVFSVHYTILYVSVTHYSLISVWISFQVDKMAEENVRTCKFLSYNVASGCIPARFFHGFARHQARKAHLNRIYLFCTSRYFLLLFLSCRILRES